LTARRRATKDAIGALSELREPDGVAAASRILDDVGDYIEVVLVE
jgi:hypothetical protein